ncbi:unnamed protein product [Cylindrotheca closterium]|uniref:BZIP domain-containing protein n=1 Tax=Cylindrotheca closterium TaxID=2856 RepID=A0AAD2G0D6_9STRA|nr:unnamed protein product [Cylindrotheca closterium]
MTTSDWHPDDDGLTVDPCSDEPSTDLFVGELLGDELIDIYNAAVVGGGDDDDDMNEIPSLLAPTPDIKKEQETTGQGGSSQDDGFGAFRSSNSFNDLTILPQPPAVPLVAETATSLPQSIAPHSVVNNDATKKRALEAAAASPAPKRRAIPSKKPATGPPVLKAKAKAPASAVPVQKAIKPNIAGRPQNKKDTPNPLTLAKTQPSTIAAKATHTKKPTNPPVAPASTVAPRVPVTAKEAEAKKSEDAAPVLSNPPTEADFKCVAQAAVSNLIMNAGQTTKSDPVSGAAASKGGSNVDISTEHVKALTGSNWVSVCSGGDSSSSQGANNGDKMNNRARRQNLTPDERARQNRDRNREHARNTRLRKKAYVEELKRTLTALVAQRDAAELEKRHTVQREMEQREVRFRVIEEFLKLRARNERNFARWSAILEDRFTFTLPLTDFRSMVHHESSQTNNGFEQVLNGVAEAMEDSNHLAAFIQSLSKHYENDEIVFAYSCDRKNFLMDNCHAVLEWTASTHGAMKQGTSSELTVKGSAKAHFSPASNKLISVSLAYDTGIVMSQVNQIKEGSPDEVAAQVAASEADAILDSLQMPDMPGSVPSNVTVLPSTGSGPGPASITDAEKEDSSDESNEEILDGRRQKITS